MSATRADAAPSRLGAGAVRWIAAHWLFAANATFVAILAGAAVAPALRALGHDEAARAIHTLYLLLCPQRPEHSYVLFGYQTALEHREIAMLGALILGGMAFGLARPRAPRLGFPVVVLAAVPMLWDVATQTLELRDSDWLTRTWTAALFCLAYVFWLYPPLDGALRGRAGSRRSRPKERAADRDRGAESTVRGRARVTDPPPVTGDGGRSVAGTLEGA